MKDYFNVKVAEIEGIIAEERKNIGKLHPVTDTRFRCGKEVLIKYAAIIRDGSSRDGERHIQIAWDTCANFHDNENIPAEMWYCCGEYEICKEDAIIGWLFSDELDEALS